MVYIGIDLGNRRVGVAFSESGVFATPLRVIPNGPDLVERVAVMGEEREAAVYVVGIPRQQHADRRLSRYERFAADLRQRTCKEVVLWNEALSTVAAAEELRSRGMKRRRIQDQIDRHAAAVILQSFLDQRGRTA